MDIVAFYQDATQNAGDEDAVWKKFGAAKGSNAPPGGAGSLAAAVEQAGTNAAASVVHPPGGVYEKPVSNLVASEPLFS